MNAFVIAGTHSGSGKTTIALALMAFFTVKGFKVQPYKVGPDFIDPGLHTIITGRSSRNLDGWMLTKDYNISLFSWISRDADMAIVEGVMGIYDGFDGKSEDGSTAQMAKWLGLPVILVIDARSMARSVAALVHGFTTFDPGISWGGIILNRVAGEGHFEYLKDALSSSLPHLPILGWIPRDDSITLPERHLGLVTADETPLDKDWIGRATALVEKHIDIEALLARTTVRKNPSSCPFTSEPQSDVHPNTPVTIAIARDAAFCFYYEDNLEFLRTLGARLMFFSPLAGETIPSGCDALILWGGYPEMHAEQLAANKTFLEDIRSSFQSGIPIYAECGGLMALSRFIEDWHGKKWSMAGILPFGTRMLKRRKALGYVEVELLRNSILGNVGTTVRGHEFHYSEICDEEKNPELDTIYRVSRRKGDEGRKEGYAVGNAVASYVHQHWGSNPEVPRNIVSFLRRRNQCPKQNP